MHSCTTHGDPEPSWTCRWESSKYFLWYEENVPRVGSEHSPSPVTYQQASGAVRRVAGRSVGAVCHGPRLPAPCLPRPVAKRPATTTAAVKPIERSPLGHFPSRKILQSAAESTLTNVAACAPASVVALADHVWSLDALALTT